MRKLVLLAVLAISSVATANSVNSISWNSNYGSESYTYSYSGYNYLFGYSYGTGSNGYWNEMEFDAAKTGNGLYSGWAWDYFQTKSGYNEFYGSLSNGTFNTTTDVFKATFTGYDYTYNYNTGWTYTPYSGTFTDHINPGSGNGAWCYGTLGNGSISSVPEPGTLGMLGTGLLSIGGLLRRKYKG